MAAAAKPSPSSLPPFWIKTAFPPNIRQNPFDLNCYSPLPPSLRFKFHFIADRTLVPLPVSHIMEAPKTIKIGSRASDLAMKQAVYVQSVLQVHAFLPLLLSDGT